MPTVTISLRDEVKMLAEAEATKNGQTLDEYVADLITAHSDRPVDPALEAELLKALNSPGREFSSAAWGDKVRRFEELQRRGK
jgi:hypothetical protein